jgi:uncharacterized protein YdhG (YjbR/CyaY superfamily)
VPKTTPAKKRTRPAASSTSRAGKKNKGFTNAERTAMKDRARELKAESRGGAGDGERELLAKIAAMPERDRALATRLHAIVTSAAPTLSPKTWYGMPAYARDGKVVCFFRFSDQAHLDEGAMWPTAFALTQLTPDAEATIRALLKKAVGEGGRAHG